ncbi:YihY family inner membrane protein [Natronococcus sp. JC468]|uniref:YhjD/YihY/BrkB family envelope integrity protein n=1 Tax=Natronococcus sp. JC468 TaxID=1961921 RepID=UPI00143B1530|nr:YhjD/YihY/BrkB family envelope integrity protein [Natronococcus sp. JC468]NKE37786.1 YihY family inner membrane protein [Natronococcus sp. JC468]
MSATARSGIAAAKSVVGGIQEKNVTFMAASIAYQAFISLIPLLVLVFFLVSVVGDEQLATEVSATTEGFLPESGQVILEDGIEGSTGSAGASIIGLVTLIWGSLKIFRGLDTAFSEIYESAAENSFLEQLRDAFVVFGAIAIALLAAAGATTAFAVLPDVPFIGVLNPILLIVGLTFAFLPMYYFFPDVDVSVREIVPGVVVAAVGWAALQSLFQVYVAVASGSDAAGPVGAILLLLTWLYFGGLILLVGAVVNATRSGRLTLEDDDDESIARKRRLERSRRTNDRLRREVGELRRERNKIRQDLQAHRSRRYHLEDRVDELDGRVRTLEDENERLRSELDVRDDPEWKQAIHEAASRIETLRIGTIRER